MNDKTRETGAAGKKHSRNPIVPVTSTTLLRDIGGDSQHARWWEFEKKYRPMMESFLKMKRVSREEWDDIIQETLVGIMKALPNYHYCPEEKGPFHSFLRRILWNKIKDSWDDQKLYSRHAQELGEHVTATGKMQAALDYDTGGDEDEGVAERVFATMDRSEEDERKEWEMSLCQIAVQQLLIDEDVSSRDREIFRRAWLNEENASSVADSLMVSRDVVYQVKHRLVKRVEETVQRLREVEE